MNNQQKLRELLCLKLKLMRLRRKRLLLSALQKPRRICQRNILQKRPAVGEFSTLVSDLKSEPKDFFEYFRMQRAAFDEILDLVKEKTWHPPNHQNPIYPEQRLAVTVTFLFDFQMVLRTQITPMLNNIHTSRNNRIKSNIALYAKAQHCQNWRVKTKHVQGSTGKDTVRKKKPVCLPRQK